MSLFQFALPVNGMTLVLNIGLGSIVMYGSNRIQDPNEAFHDFMLTNSTPKIFIDSGSFQSSSSQISEQQVPPGFTNITVFVSIEGRDANNSFILNTSFIEDTTSKV